MGGAPEENEEITEEQLAELVEDESTTEGAAEEVAEATTEEVTAPAGLTKEDVEAAVRAAVTKAQPAAREPAPASEEPDDDAEMPVTRREMAQMQQQLATNQQVAQLRAELAAAASQYPEHDAETQQDLWNGAVRSLHANPGLSAADAYRGAVKRHEKAVDRGIKRRINKAAEAKANRGEPMGPSSGGAIKVPELPKDFDATDDAQVSAFAQKIIDDMTELPGVAR